jgi:hypothetical protein
VTSINYGRLQSDAYQHDLNRNTGQRSRARGDPPWSFAWGRSGASARELAWSILHDSTQDASLADDWCSDFTAEVVSRLPPEAFCLASRDVLDWLYGEL